MNEKPYSPEDSQLARQLKALAIALLKDDAAADDIVQEVWLASLKMPPSSYSGGKAWLIAVTKNLARSEIRSRVHRRDRERSVAIPEVAMESSSAVEQASVRERLVEAVRSLDQPYADVVYARFFEESTPAEIAENEGCSLATIRTRLQRGIKRLRARLDAEYGGSAAFGIALVGAFDWTPGDLGTPTGAGTGTATRGLLGGTSPVAVAIAALLAAVGVFIAVTLLGTDSDASDGRSDLEDVAGGVPDLSDPIGKFDPNAELVPQEGGVDRVAFEEESGAASIAAESIDDQDDGASTAAADRDSGVVLLGVRDQNRLPVIGARILVVQDLLGTVRATTDSKGNAELAWTADDLTWILSPDVAARGADRLILVAHADGFAASGLIMIVPSEEGDRRVGLLVGGPGSNVSGRVLDLEGRGVEGARISIRGGLVSMVDETSGSVTALASIDTLSGPGGEYRFHGLSPDESHLICRVPGVGVASASFSRDESGLNEIELDLQLVPGASIRGTLKTDAGLPLEGVKVSFEVRSTPWLTTFSTVSGPDGTYNLEALPVGKFIFRLRGAGMDRFARLTLRAGEETRHDATLVAGRRFTISVVDLDGEPIEKARVDARVPVADWRQGLRTNASGDVTFIDLPLVGRARRGSNAAGPIEVTVKGNAPSGALVLMAAIEMTSIGPHPLVIECDPDFSNLRAVTGVIVDHTGAALTDAWVHLSGARSQPMLYTGVQPSDGSFRFQDVRPGPYDLLVRTPWSQHFYARSVEVESDPTDIGLIRLPGPARVHIDWAWGEGGPAVRFQIHEQVELGSRNLQHMVASGDRDKQSIELLPGSYVVLSFSGAGAVIEQRMLHCRSGVDVTVSLGPDSPQRCLVTIECEQVETPEMAVTVHALYDIFVGSGATDGDLEEHCLDAELLLDGTALRTSSGSYQFDFEFARVGTFITRIVAPDGRVAFEYSVMGEFRQASCLDFLNITFD